MPFRNGVGAFYSAASPSKAAPDSTPFANEKHYFIWMISQLEACCNSCESVKNIKITRHFPLAAALPEVRTFYMRACLGS